MSDQTQIWLEGTSALAWDPGSSSVLDQWGVAHGTTSCVVDSGTLAGCDYVDYYTTSRPDQHGGAGQPDTSWKGAGNATTDITGASGTVTGVTRAGAAGTQTYGDLVTITVPVDQYEQWVINGNTDVPQTIQPCWGINPTCTEPVSNPPWTDYVITLEYVQDYGATVGSGTGTDGWIIKNAMFTAYFMRNLEGGAVETTMTVEVSAYKSAANGGTSHSNTLKQNFGSATWWLPGFYNGATPVVPGNNYWEVCKKDVGARACVHDTPSAYNTATGYILQGDFVEAGSGSLGAKSFGGFGEMTFGLAVPEPGTALLLGAGLIGLASIRRRNG